MLKSSLVLLLALVAVSCGSSPDAPTAPSVAQVAGVWRGSLTTTAVTGGECFAPLFPAAVGGSNQISAAVTQNGSALTASITALATGGVCNYAGTAGISAVQLSWTNCSSSNILGATCTNGSRRDLLLVNSSFTGTVVGNSITGTEADTYNIVVSGTSAGVGILTIGNSFSVTRQ